MFLKSNVRFLLPLVVFLILVALFCVTALDRYTTAWFRKDIDIRAKLISNTMHTFFTNALNKNDDIVTVEKVLNRVTKDERLYAVILCNASGERKFESSEAPKQITCQPLSETKEAEILTVKYNDSNLRIFREPLELGSAIIVHDMKFASERTFSAKVYIFLVFLGLAAIISIVTVLIARAAIKGFALGVRELIRGKGEIGDTTENSGPEFTPIVKEMKALVRELKLDKRLAESASVVWSPETLRQILHSRLADDQVIIVSNREPYIHNKNNGKIELQFPASGVVTALEPIVKACAGTWIAHGSGSADKEVVDQHDHIAVPPGENLYSLRRIWLTEEEEQGYYYGFANEGLWPLCHIAHTRPTFRSSDWDYYQKINERFAEAVLAEAKADDPVVLVQDYHFALLPSLIKQRLPKATIITFWHIPWPNPEVFGICPWREEILKGLLGSTIVGFHTGFHRNNFLETVDRFIESRINYEDSTVSCSNEMTAVKSYPISIDWESRWKYANTTIEECRTSILKRHKLDKSIKVAVGVERLDYTKGIVERFYAVERLLELHPEYVGKFTLVQIAAPSRSKIESYKTLAQKVQDVAAQINSRFENPNCLPIILIMQHHNPSEVAEYFRASDLCLVTSLHDGMNLVAKEYIASRDDEQGVLILSMFAGASRELPESLIINPYSTNECANALNIALKMSPEEQKSRMQSMREQVKEFNVFRWAGRMLLDAAKVRERNRLLEQLPEINASLEDQGYQVFR